MVGFGDILGKGLRFSVEPKRWLPFFIIDMAMFGLVLWVFFSNMTSLVYALLNIRTNPLAMVPFMGYFVWLFMGFIIYVLINLWIQGAVIHQSYKEKERIENSFRFSAMKFLSLLAAVFVITVLSGMASVIPYIGWILSIVLSLVFFFTLQAIIIRNTGFYKGLEDSYKIFRKDPLGVFVIWLFVLAITLLIVFVFSLPMLGFLAGALMGLISGQMDASFLLNLLFFARANITMLVISAVIMLVGMAISKVFALKAQTEFYLKIRKRHGIF